MAYKVIILYQLYMPSYFLGTFTEYPFLNTSRILSPISIPGFIVSFYPFFFVIRKTFISVAGVS